ncbi:energy transducer TonB family protein [Flaviaesturariibacter terrae]
MKATVLSALLLILSLAGFCNEETPAAKKAAATVAASYPGGDSAFSAFVSTVLTKAMHAGIAHQLPAGSYIVTLSFDVDARGNVSNIQPVSRNGYGLEEAAIAQFRSTRRWTPARNAAGTVKAHQTQSFRFDVF